MAAARQAALGFSVHTGWAAVVAVAGSLDAPEVVDRRKLDLIGVEGGDSARFVYHAASELELSAAKQLVVATTRAVNKATLTGLRAVVVDLKERGLQVASAAIITGGSRPLGTLEATLRSHAAIHTAEGQLYRGAIADACCTLGLAVVEFPARELSDLAAHRVGIAATTMAVLVADMKRCVGAPWGHDQKQSMTAAWAVLAPDVKAKPSSPPPRRQK